MELLQWGERGRERDRERERKRVKIEKRERKREREREQGDAIHPLTPLVYESGWNGIHSLFLWRREGVQGKRMSLIHPPPHSLRVRKRMEWHSFTPFAKERGRTRGMIFTHPSTQSPCMCKWMEWETFTPFTKERKREREQGDAIHSLTPLVFDNGWNGIHSFSL